MTVYQSISLPTPVDQRLPILKVPNYAVAVELFVVVIVIVNVAFVLGTIFEDSVVVAVVAEVPNGSTLVVVVDVAIVFVVVIHESMIVLMSVVAMDAKSAVEAYVRDHVAI